MSVTRAAGGIALSSLLLRNPRLADVVWLGLLWLFHLGLERLLRACGARVGAGARRAAAVDLHKRAHDRHPARVDPDEPARALDGQIADRFEHQRRPGLEVDLLASLERVVLPDLALLIAADTEG